MHKLAKSVVTFFRLWLEALGVSLEWAPAVTLGVGAGSAEWRCYKGEISGTPAAAREWYNRIAAGFA